MAGRIGKLVAPAEGIAEPLLKSQNQSLNWIKKMIQEKIWIRKNLLKALVASYLASYKKSPQISLHLQIVHQTSNDGSTIEYFSYKGDF